MLQTADEIYVNGVHGDSDALQAQMAGVLRDFHKDTAEMTRNLRDLKAFFLSATHSTLPEGGERMLGVTTTAVAFDVDPEEAMSPSPEDTRMAFVLGKPVAIARKDGTWEMGLEKRYVVGIRVEPNRITMTKVLTIVQPVAMCLATGRPENEHVRKEAERVSRETSTSVCECVARVRTYTKEQVDKLLARTDAAFDALMRSLEARLGTVAIAGEVAVSLKRAHSMPMASRCDTMAVDAVAASVAPALGAADEAEVRVPPPRPTRG